MSSRGAFYVILGVLLALCNRALAGWNAELGGIIEKVVGVGACVSVFITFCHKFRRENCRLTLRLLLRLDEGGKGDRDVEVWESIPFRMLKKAKPIADGRELLEVASLVVCVWALCSVLMLALAR